MAPARTFPLKQPKGHKPPVPRWLLKLPDQVSHVYTIYVGVQCRGDDRIGCRTAEEIVQSLLGRGSSGVPAIDTFRVTDGFDLVNSKVWVAYFTDQEAFNDTLESLDLIRLWRELGDDRESVGLWFESFTTPIERLETNYSRLDHKPGLAQLPGVEQPSHELTAYWGAGRDRLPASAHDLCEKPNDIRPPSNPPVGIGEHIKGTNYDNMCHIRSGQWWHKCSGEEREAYETELQPTLMNGMNYLWDNPDEAGTLGLRFLQNLDDDGNPIRETCGAGFHRNWADLERWSSRHPSHLAIFNGAMRHAKRFGEDRKLMTWHEVSILKAGEASFEYVNCDPKTGVIRYVDLERRKLSEAS